LRAGGRGSASISTNPASLSSRVSPTRAIMSHPPGFAANAMERPLADHGRTAHDDRFRRNGRNTGDIGQASLRLLPGRLPCCPLSSGRPRGPRPALSRGEPASARRVVQPAQPDRNQRYASAVDPGWAGIT
jgi:hypothetical protein